jgi:4-amino-4-deoxy-L-arabinose transferase-like glycosyltransferase
MGKLLEHKRPLGFALLLALLYFAALAAFLKIPEIGGSSEAREAQVASVIVRTSEWILPLRNGLVPSKPPLFHWITAAVATVSQHPVTPALARCTSAMAAAGVLFLVVLLSLELLGQFPRHRMQSKFTIGFIAAVVLSCNYAFTILALHAMVDMTYTFFATAALYALMRRCGPDNHEVVSAEFGTQIRSGDLTLFFIASGVAVLGKGPLGLALPVICGFTALALRYGIRPALKIFLKPRLAWLLFLMLALPWYVFAGLQGIGNFFERQWFFENVQRLTGGEDIRTAPIWFYIPQFIRFAAPWSIILLVMLLKWWRAPVSYPSPFAEERRTKNLFLFIFAVGFLFFSLAAGKRHTYLLPLYPWLSLYLAWHLFDWYQDLAPHGQQKLRQIGARAVRVLPYLWLSLILAFELVKLPFSSSSVVLGSARNVLVNWAVSVELIAFVLLLVGLFSTSHVPRRNTAVWLNLFSFQLLFCAIIQLGLAVRNDLQGYAVVSDGIRKLVPANAALGVVRGVRDEYFDPILYYLDREVTLLDPSTDSYPAQTYLLAQEAWVQEQAGLLTKQHAVEVMRTYRKSDLIKANPQSAIVLLHIGETRGS